MICTNCSKNLSDKDFFLKQTVCYHCIYQIKTREKKQKIYKCQECQCYFSNDQKCKKRPRTVYCSLICAARSRRNPANDHWTKKLRKAVPQNFGYSPGLGARNV